MTYRGQPVGSGSRVLRALVVITIALVAYWAATGGLDEIPAPNIGNASITQSQ